MSRRTLSALPAEEEEDEWTYEYVTDSGEDGEWEYEEVDDKTSKKKEDVKKDEAEKEKSSAKKEEPTTTKEEEKGQKETESSREGEKKAETKKDIIDGEMNKAADETKNGEAKKVVPKTPPKTPPKPSIEPKKRDVSLVKNDQREVKKESPKEEPKRAKESITEQKVEPKAIPLVKNTTEPEKTKKSDVKEGAKAKTDKNEKGNSVEAEKTSKDSAKAQTKRRESASPEKKMAPKDGGERLSRIDEGKRNRRESASPAKRTQGEKPPATPPKTDGKAEGERLSRSRADESAKRRVTVEQLGKQKLEKDKERSMPPPKTEEKKTPTEKPTPLAPKKPVTPRSHSSAMDVPRKSVPSVLGANGELSKGKGRSTSIGMDRARSISPVKSVQERRRAFVNPAASPLIIDNVPRGNLLARFLPPERLPKPPPPPPKKEFKWQLPTTSKALESTYWKPPPKPQPYKSSAPEFRDNPLIIEPILTPEEQKAYEEDKKKEEEELKEKEAKEKKEEKGKKKATEKSEEVKGAPVKSTAVKEKEKTTIGAKKKSVEPKKPADTKKKPAVPKKPTEKKKVAQIGGNKWEDMKKKLEDKAKKMDDEMKAKEEDVARKKEKKGIQKREEKNEEEGEEGEEVKSKNIRKDEKVKDAAKKDKEVEIETEGEMDIEDEEEKERSADEQESGEENEENAVDEEEAEGAEADAEDEEEGEEDKENVEDEEEADEDEAEANEDEDEPSKKRRRKSRRRKRQKAKKPKEPKPQRKWVPPPRPPPEAIEMPPEEKHIWEIGREEVRHGQRPAKMYAKKEREESIEMPFVLPWEACPALQTQSGMSAFGAQRDPKINVDEGQTPLVQGALKSETLLPLFEDLERQAASQKGFGGFGAHRRNVARVVDSHEYETDDKLHLSESVIPRHMLGSVQSHDLEPMWGNLRSQTTKVVLKEGMQPGHVPDSDAFIGRQFSGNPNNHAGNNVIDRRRNVIQMVEGVGELKPHPFSEGIVPKLFSTDEINSRSGSEFGAFRPVIAESTGGYRMSYEEEMRCKMVIPYQTRPSRAHYRQIAD